MPELRFQLCVITEKCPPCFKVDVADFPILSSYYQYRIDKGTEMTIQFVRTETGETPAMSQNPRTYLDPDLITELVVTRYPVVGSADQVSKFQWFTPYFGAGDFWIVIYGKLGTISSGRLFTV